MPNAAIQPVYSKFHHISLSSVLHCQSSEGPFLPRFSHFSITFAFTCIMSVQVAFAKDAHAQDGTEERIIVPCATNNDLDGQLYSGMFGVISSIDDFTNVTLSNNNLSVYPSVRTELSVLVFSGEYRGPYSQGGAKESAGVTGSTTQVRFSNARGEVVHTCTIAAVAFDPSIHDLSNARFGFCDFDRNSSITQIREASQDFTLPEKLTEVSAAPKNVLDALPIYGARGFEVFGRAPGVGTIVWSKRDTGQGTIGGVCPFEVRH